MADVKKINGYNIKDASARNDISSLDTRVGALETTINTPNTGLSGRVSDLETTIDTPSTGLSARVGDLENEVEDLSVDSYSFDEVKTTKTWIDGKPIYRKIVFIGDLSDDDLYVDNAVRVSADISNMDALVSLSAMGTDGDTSVNLATWFRVDTTILSAVLVEYLKSSDEIYVASIGSYRPSWITISWAVLEYTKTTDVVE